MLIIPASEISRHCKAVPILFRRIQHPGFCLLKLSAIFCFVNQIMQFKRICFQIIKFIKIVLMGNILIVAPSKHSVLKFPFITAKGFTYQMFTRLSAEQIDTIHRVFRLNVCRGQDSSRQIQIRRKISAYLFAGDRLSHRITNGIFMVSSTISVSLLNKPPCALTISP